MTRTVLFLMIALGLWAADVPSNRGLPVPPPKGARVLWDGTNLDQWIEYHNYLDKFQPASAHFLHFRTAEAIMQVSTAERPSDSQCYLATKEEFGNIRRLHVEFLVPAPAGEIPQLRGNSGVYLQGRYELQILESFGLPISDTDNGALYKLHKPRVNASLPPNQWQSFDIEFRAGKIDGAQVVRRPRITVRHNGVVIHRNVELNAPATQRFTTGNYTTKGPVILQNHWCPVQFRNIWVLP